jgi:hypothetical protein
MNSIIAAAALVLLTMAPAYAGSVALCKDYYRSRPMCRSRCGTIWTIRLRFM